MLMDILFLGLRSGAAPAAAAAAAASHIAAQQTNAGWVSAQAVRSVCRVLDDSRLLNAQAHADAKQQTHPHIT
jgi:hypothetical protein